jgi:CDGSH-type Zn-finger protein
MEMLATRNGSLRITATKNGPLKIEGPLEIVSGTGTTLAKTAKTWLCRCGHSSNKPFCDGTHSKIGFQSE